MIYVVTYQSRDVDSELFTMEAYMGGDRIKALQIAGILTGVLAKSKYFGRVLVTECPHNHQQECAMIFREVWLLGRKLN